MCLGENLLISVWIIPISVHKDEYLCISVCTCAYMCVSVYIQKHYFGDIEFFKFVVKMNLVLNPFIERAVVFGTFTGPRTSHFFSAATFVEC